MTIRTASPFRSALALAVLAVAGAVAACARDEAAQAPAGDCDRACLIDLLDNYMSAVAAHDPALAPLADDYRVTENAREVRPGEGVWDTVTALGSLQRRYADAEMGQALYVGLIGEGQSTAIASLRIQVRDRQISEADWVIARDETPLFNPAGFTANPPPDQFVLSPAAEGREAALAAADSYFEGLQIADAGGVIAHEGCFRIENGSWMVGRLPDRDPVDPAEAQPGFNIALTTIPTASCAAGFHNLVGQISAVANRRYFYDETAGVVWGGATFERPEGAVGPSGALLTPSHLSNIFLLQDGKILGIYSISTRL